LQERDMLVAGVAQAGECCLLWWCVFNYAWLVQQPPRAPHPHPPLHSLPSPKVAQANGLLPMVTLTNRRDPRDDDEGEVAEIGDGEGKKKIVIHTDYPLLKTITSENSASTLRHIEFTEDPMLATHWFHIRQEKVRVAITELPLRLIGQLPLPCTQATRLPFLLHS
jgi:hypothetical protein